MPELGVGGAVHHHGPGDTTLRDQMAVVWRRKWLVVVPTLVAVALALIVSATQPERYRASTDVLIKRPPSATNVVAPDSALTAREVQNELLRARGSTIQDAARTVLGAEPDLSVGLASSDNADVLVFTAESRDPERAAVAADTYAEVYIEARRAALTSDYEARVKVVQERLVEVDRRLAEYPDGAVDEEFVDLVTQKSQMQLELEGLITSISLANESGAQVIDAAQVPDAPFRPTPLRTATLALVVGLLIGLGLAFLVDRLDDKIRDEADLARSTGLPVLAVVPKLKEWQPSDTHVVAREEPSSPPAESYRGLRTALQFRALDQPTRIVQVTSPQSGDGKSTTAANLAVVCAKAGQRVLLVDCDLRRPRLHRFFDLPNEVGFTSVLMGAARSEAQHKIDGEPSLTVMTSGPIPPDPSEVLSGRSAQQLLQSLAEGVDLVVVDSPPVLLVSDPLILSGSMDGVVLVTSAGTTELRQAAHAVAQLASVGAPVFGAVLNEFDPRRGSAYDYRYSYGVYAS